jgi:hypothetical protein
VRVRLRDLVARPQHRVQLLPQLLLDLRVVHQLRDRPLDRPQRCLDRCRGKTEQKIQYEALPYAPRPRSLAMCTQNISSFTHRIESLNACMKH